MLGTKFEKPLQSSFVQKIEYIETENEKGEIVKIPRPKNVPNDAPNTLAKYSEMIRWCNANNARMVDRGEYYEVIATPEPTAEELQAQALAQAKSERAEAVKTITVEVDGLIFDGDEDSQTRMARTITASQALGLPEDSTISWAMADTNANKVEQVTIAQLSKALYLAGCKQSELWCKPYGVTGTTQTGLEYLNSLGQ